MSIPVENILETWATHKQTQLDASFLYSESQKRVWNILEQEISQKSSNSVIFQSSNTWSSIFRQAWSTLIPVGLVAAAVVLLVSYGDRSQLIAPGVQLNGSSGQAPVVAAISPQVEVVTGAPQAEPTTQPVATPQQNKIPLLARQKSKKRVVYAQPGQSVFVSWATSVYTPVTMARSNTPVSPRAAGVFTQ